MRGVETAPAPNAGARLGEGGRRWVGLTGRRLHEVCLRDDLVHCIIGQGCHRRHSDEGEHPAGAQHLARDNNKI